MALSGTELGSLQIAESGASLRLVAQCGFGRDFADYFAVVADDASACGRAVSNGAQTVIPDVTVDAEFAPHRAVAAESGFRAVQSTPLVDVHGLLVGMVSTHFVRPGPLPDRTTRLLRLYGRYAAEAMRRALPDTPTAPAPAPPEERPAPSPRSGLSEADSRVLDLFDDVVRSLFAAGLNLAAAQSLVGGDAGSEVAEAIDRLDHALGGVRTAVLALHD